MILGVNSRLDAIQAAILRVKLKHLSTWSKERAKKANYYTKNLTMINEVIPPLIKKDRNHIFHQYTLRVPPRKREEMVAYLNNNGVPTMIYYPLPLHLQPALRYLGYKKGDFPESEKAAKEVLSLPIYPELSKKEQDFVVKKIKQFFNVL